MPTSFLADLKARGLVHQMSSEEELDKLLAAERVTGYIGFDPTADSLHIGSLLQIMLLMRLQRAGHRPLALVGGCTGLIGDPSGKEAERNMLSVDAIASNAQGIHRQLEQFLDFGKGGALLENNLEWLGTLDLVTFLRDIGKHFSVNQMVQRDSVRMRLERSDQGISYTEFTYMLLQAYDFLELYRRHGCRLQIGGSDQWGNIVSGTDLIRRLEGGSAYALTSPLITRSDGKKFGKTEAGNVWLDAARTTPFEFYQFWLNVDDRDAVPYLRYFTFLEREQIEELEQQHQRAPEDRAAQRELAARVTELVHGTAALERALRTSLAFFGKLEWSALSRQELDEAFLHVPRTQLARSDVGTEAAGMLHVLSASKLYPSRGRARKDVENGAISVNGEKRADPAASIQESDLLADCYVVLRRGKKTYHVLEFNASG